MNSRSDKMALDDIMRTEAAEAAPLDVERLARAMLRVGIPWLTGSDEDGLRQIATEVAAEYAALRSPDTG